MQDSDGSSRNREKPNSHKVFAGLFADIYQLFPSQAGTDAQAYFSCRDRDTFTFIGLHDNAYSAKITLATCAWHR